MQRTVKQRRCFEGNATLRGEDDETMFVREGEAAAAGDDEKRDGAKKTTELRL